MSISQTTVQSHRIKSRKQGYFGAYITPRFDPPDHDVRQEETIEDACQAAREVRFIYKAFYRRLRNNVRRPPAKRLPASGWGADIWGNPLDDPVWEQIAHYISLLELPYFEFIRHRFHSRKRGLPRKRDMLSDIGTGNLAFLIELATEDRAYRLQADMALHEAICGGNTRDLFADGPTHQLARRPEDERSCLFLYSMAVRQEEPSWARLYRADALRQYLTEPYAYSVTWQEVLPENIYYDALAFFSVEPPLAPFRHQVDERDLTIAQ